MKERFSPGLDFEIHNPLFIQIIQNFIKQAVRQQLAVVTGCHVPKLLQPFDHFPRMHQFQRDLLPVCDVRLPMRDLALMGIFLPVVFHILNFTLLEQHEVVFQRPAMARNIDFLLLLKVNLICAIQVVKMGLNRQISHEFDCFRFNFQSVDETSEIILNFISKDRIPLATTLAAFRMAIAQLIPLFPADNPRTQFGIILFFCLDLAVDAVE